jgi:hypothetical protein
LGCCSDNGDPWRGRRWCLQGKTGSAAWARGDAIGASFCLFVFVRTEDEGKIDKRERAKASGRRRTVGDRWRVRIKRKEERKKKRKEEKEMKKKKSGRTKQKKKCYYGLFLEIRGVAPGGCSSCCWSGGSGCMMEDNL